MAVTRVAQAARRTEPGLQAGWYVRGPGGITARAPANFRRRLWCPRRRAARACTASGTPSPHWYA